MSWPATRSLGALAVRGWAVGRGLEAVEVTPGVWCVWPQGLAPASSCPPAWSWSLRKVKLCFDRRLFMNFLCLPDRLICLGRIDQSERFD